MAVISTITQNIPAATQQIIFYNPSEFDNITYSSNSITYATEASITLSQSDLALWFVNKLIFYNTLLFNFPTINASFNAPLPICKFEIVANPTVAHIIEYIQTSGLTSLSVYNITYNTSTNTATFTARTSPITVTLQEYLIGFEYIKQFTNQCSLV
jgi:hypothetical protein